VNGPTSTTVAIPMHASMPFLDVISANVAALPSDVQIILSDRTGADDAIDHLLRRHGDDPRIRFVRGHGVGIVEHYNRLLREADGEYFMWMPHDDSFPAEYVPLLRAALDDHPDAILAFGSIRPVDLDGALVAKEVQPDPPIELGQRSRADEAIFLWRHWQLWIPYRGLMRRREVLRRRLYLRHGPREMWHDIPWGFAMTVAAPIVFVPGCSCVKRYHPDSHHAPWDERRAVDELGDVVVVARYLASARVPWSAAAKAMAYVSARGIFGAAAHLPERVRFVVPERARRAMRCAITGA
jgi:hypothetical protein